MLLVYHPDTVEAIFNSSKDLISKSWHYRYLETWLSKGLLTSTGAKWQARRKMLTPSFHFNILGDALSTFNTQVRIHQKFPFTIIFFIQKITLLSHDKHFFQHFFSPMYSVIFYWTTL